MALPSIFQRKVIFLLITLASLSTVGAYSIYLVYGWEVALASLLLLLLTFSYVVTTKVNLQEPEQDQAGYEHEQDEKFLTERRIPPFQKETELKSTISTSLVKQTGSLNQESIDAMIHGMNEGKRDNQQVEIDNPLRYERLFETEQQRGNDFTQQNEEKSMRTEKIHIDASEGKNDPQNRMLDHDTSDHENTIEEADIESIYDGIERKHLLDHNDRPIHKKDGFSEIDEVLQNRKVLNLDELEEGAIQSDNKEVFLKRRKKLFEQLEEQ